VHAVVSRTDALDAWQRTQSSPACTECLNETSRDVGAPAGWSFSAGCATFPAEANDVDALFRVANARLYEAKRARAA